MSEVANQVSSDEAQKRTLDAAISECDKHILRHKRFSWFTLAVLVASWFFLYQAYKSKDNFDVQLGNYFAQTPIAAMPDQHNFAPTAAVAVSAKNEYLQDASCQQRVESSNCIYWSSSWIIFDCRLQRADCQRSHLANEKQRNLQALARLAFFTIRKLFRPFAMPHGA